LIGTKQQLLLGLSRDMMVASAFCARAIFAAIIILRKTDTKAYRINNGRTVVLILAAVLKIEQKHFKIYGLAQ